MPTFGGYVASLRKEKGLTLREFCRRASLDASNWSKTERDVIAPPKGKEAITNIAQALEINETADEYLELKELAAIGGISAELLDSSTITEKLPLFFRTLRGKKPTESELYNLIEKIKDA